METGGSQWTVIELLLFWAPREGMCLQVLPKLPRTVGQPAGLGVASTAQRVSTRSPHIFTLLWDWPPFTARLLRWRAGSPASQRQRHWSHPASPASDKAEGPPSDLKQDPGLCGWCVPREELQKRSPTNSASEGLLPPTQKSQCCPEEAKASFLRYF